MNTLLSRLLHALLGAFLLVMPVVSLACGGPDFATTLASDDGGAHFDGGEDVDNRPIRVYFDSGAKATSPESTPSDTPDGSVDATLDGPLPHDGSLDTANDAPAPEGSACSGLQCNGGCVPNDLRNCGTCGHDCTALPYVVAAGLSCTAGKCIYHCAPGFADCSDAGTGCGISLSQNGNCGACGVTCTGPTPVCSGPGCTSNCSSSAPTLCGSTCANTQSDSQNCGACGMQCLAGTHCLGGRCACDTSSGCAGCCSSATTCAPLANETRTSCGAGGNACGSCRVDQVCDTSRGACACPTGQTICGTACVDTLKDNFNCGACGTQCTSGTTCSAGRCVCNASSGCAGCCSGGNTCVGTSSETNPGTGCGMGGSACTACTASGQTCVGGGCACPGTQTVCGGACVDLKGDANNCGRCGHPCGDGTCSGGMCQPVVLAPGNPGSITVDGTNVYWLDGSAGVMKCGIHGCGNVPLKIASLFTNTTPAPEQIAVDALNVYWVGAIAAGNPQDILKCAISGCGTPTDLGLNADAFTLDLVNGNVYSIVSTGSGVYRVSVNGGTPSQLATGSAYPNGITMFSGTVYWTTHDRLPGSGATWSCAITGCSSSGNVIASGSDAASVIVANATGAYWTQFVGLPNQRLAPGATVSTLVGSGKDLAVDATNLYWTDGTLQTCAVNSCTNIANLTTLYAAAGQTSTGPIAIDSTSIYWGDSAKGVMKVAKP